MDVYRYFNEVIFLLQAGRPGEARAFSNYNNPYGDRDMLIRSDDTGDILRNQPPQNGRPGRPADNRPRPGNDRGRQGHRGLRRDIGSGNDSPRGNRQGVARSNSRLLREYRPTALGGSGPVGPLQNGVMPGPQRQPPAQLPGMGRHGAYGNGVFIGRSPSDVTNGGVRRINTIAPPRPPRQAREEPDDRPAANGNFILTRPGQQPEVRRTRSDVADLHYSPQDNRGVLYAQPARRHADLQDDYSPVASIASTERGPPPPPAPPPPQSFSGYAAPDAFHRVSDTGELETNVADTEPEVQHDPMDRTAESMQLAIQQELEDRFAAIRARHKAAADPDVAVDNEAAGSFEAADTERAQSVISEGDPSGYARAGVYITLILSFDIGLGPISIYK